MDVSFPAWANALLLIVAFGAAAFERVRNVKLSSTANVSLAKDELINVVTADRDAWKSRYETEHSEYVARRQQYHDELQGINADMLRLSGENAALKAKTDVTPIMQELKAQSEINQNVLKALGTIMVWCDQHEKVCAAISHGGTA